MAASLRCCASTSSCSRACRGAFPFHSMRGFLHASQRTHPCALFTIHL
jgi:hypothetical protein